MTQNHNWYIGTLLKKFPVFLLFATCGASTLSLTLSLLFGALTPTISTFSLTSGCLLALWATHKTQLPTFEKPSLWEYPLIAFYITASLKIFLWLIWEDQDWIKILSPHNYGDLSLHTHLINYIANGAKFWPESPILANTPLAYPIGMNMFNSMLTTLGIPTPRGLVLTGVAAALTTGWALWLWGRGFALATIFLSGGILGFQFLYTWTLQEYEGIPGGIDYAPWKNLFLTSFTTQRGLLYALPTGLLLLYGWREEFFRENQPIPRPVQYALYCTMPFFHVFTFLFLSYTLLLITLYNKPKRQYLVKFFLAALLPATYLMWLVTGEFSLENKFRWNPGWMLKNSPPLEWLYNFGLYCLLPLTAILTYRANSKENQFFTVLSMSTLLFCLLFAITPWEWDNTKIMLWGLVAYAPTLWTLLKKLPTIIRTGTLIALFFSGTIAILAAINLEKNSHAFIKRSELDAMHEALAHIPYTQTLAVPPDNAHPAMLLGRPVVCGYLGHLASHGLPYTTTNQKLQEILSKKPGWEKHAHELGVQWIVTEKNPPQLEPVPAP